MGQHQRLAWHDVCPTSHEVQVCVAASPTRHSPSHHAQQPHLSLWPQSQLGKRWCSAAGFFCDDPQSTPLRASAHTFWMRDWSFFGLRIGLLFWAMFRAECDVAPVQNTTRRTDKQQMQSRVRKVATLACTGEKGRALPPARNAPPVPVTEQIVQEIKSLYPADPEPPAPAQAFVSILFLSEVAEHVPTTLRKMPRLSEPGPLGMRAEHWYDFGSLAGNSDLFVQVIAHMAAAAVSQPSATILKSWTDHTTCQTHRQPHSS